MRIAVTGSTGMIGSRLVAALGGDGHEVMRVVRPGGSGSDASAGAAGADPGGVGVGAGNGSGRGQVVRWDPAAGTIDADALEGLDAVVHLAGAPIGPKRWTPERKEAIRSSRVEGTTLLARALAGLDRPPRVLLSASGIDWYGETGDQVVTEESPPGTGFMAEVCQAWEQAAEPAAEAGIRTVFLRSAMVLDPRGGALGQMLLPFRLGLGGRTGSGRQWWSWIAVDDWVGAARFLLDADVAGPVNLSAPEPVRNTEFTRALGAALRRPAVIPTPRLVPRLMLGRELAESLLYASHRVVPAVLQSSGYEFRHPRLDDALRSLLTA